MAPLVYWLGPLTQVFKVVALVGVLIFILSIFSYVFHQCDVPLRLFTKNSTNMLSRPFSLTWPDSFCEAAYRLEIISAVLKGSG